MPRPRWSRRVAVTAVASRPEQVGEEVEVVDGVGLGHAHVRPRALEAREAAGAVAHAARAPPRPAARAARSVTGWKRKMWPTCSTRPVAATIAASSRPSATVRVSGFSTKQCAARAQALPGQRPGDCRPASRGPPRPRAAARSRKSATARAARHPRLDREGAPLRRDVGHPQLHAQLAEHAQVLLAPAPQPDQQHFHRPRLPGSPPRSSATS